MPTTRHVPTAHREDDEFFERARSVLTLATADLVAVGSTRRSGARPDDDDQVVALLEAGTSAGERAHAHAEGPLGGVAPVSAS